ncbi:kinase-like domain-containing protein [Rhizophagus irregularis DAOM 181602=DAOM 197198]|uniref:Uncharacterized protein n=1 Tax=Rhizophagus irregularis (strain DAOM 181602 / DAOM 197198 / MUCL 43194) TaxID=747089 RepID=U9UJ40_RHIID|nr:kinase-like domain-containing protein [Rhizophagus irregularis DAOM 181602=DAOM 197198]
MVIITSDANGPVWSDLKPKSSRTDKKSQLNRAGLKAQIEPSQAEPAADGVDGNLLLRRILFVLEIVKVEQ